MQTRLPIRHNIEGKATMRSTVTCTALILLTALAAACAMDSRAARPVSSSAGTLAAGSSDTHALDLDADMFVFGEVHQTDVDVTVTVTAPSGETLRDVDTRTRGIESFQFETETAGTYEIEVAADGEEEAGSYELRIIRSEAIATDPAERLDQLMSPWDGDDRPGAVVGVVEDGELALVRDYGMANLSHGVPWERGTISNIGSVTKQFTAMGILLLQAEGKLSLDDDIRKHIPELPDFGTPVTIRNLLNHTGGFREIYNLLPIQGLEGEDAFARGRAITVVQRQPELQARPNTEWNYNNTGFILLSLTVERLSGQTFSDYMGDNVFMPLGMHDTRVKMVQGELIPGSAQGYTPVEGGSFRTTRDLAASAGAGGVYTTVDDLARWMLNYRDATLGGPEVIKAITTEAVLESGDSTGYGLGLGIGEMGGRTLYSHTGGDISHRAYLSFFPELESGVIVMSNHAGFDLGVGGRIARLFFGDDLEEEEEAVADVEDGTGEEAGMSDERKEAIAGDWVIEVQGLSIPLAVMLEDGEVFVEFDGQSRTIARPTSDSTMTLVAADATLTFSFEPDGSLTTGTLVQAGTEMALRRAENAELSEEELEAYAGRYFSEELETFYVVTVEDGALVARHLDMADPLTLRHTGGGNFSSSVVFLNTIAFERAGNDGVTGFTVSNGRTKGVWFRKM